MDVLFLRYSSNVKYGLSSSKINGHITLFHPTRRSYVLSAYAPLFIISRKDLKLTNDKSHTISSSESTPPCWDYSPRYLWTVIWSTFIKSPQSDIMLWYVFACYDFFATILDKHLSLANTFVITSLVTLNLIPGLEHGFDFVWFISNINWK